MAKGCVSRSRSKHVLGHAIVALLYLILIQYDDAAALLLQIFCISSRTAGLNHPESTWAMHNLTCVWGLQGQRDQVIEMISNCIQLRKTTLKSDHPHLVKSMNLLELLRTRDNSVDSFRAHEQRESELKRLILGCWSWNSTRLSKHLATTNNTTRTRQAHAKSSPHQSPLRIWWNAVKEDIGLTVVRERPRTNPLRDDFHNG